MSQQQQQPEKQQATQPTANLPPLPNLETLEQKQQYIIEKTKEFFERNAFMQRKMMSHAYSSSNNSLALSYLSREFRCAEMNMTDAELFQVLSSESLKEVVVVNEKNYQVSPTWKRFRNIFYLMNFSKDCVEEIRNLIKSTLSPVEVQFTIESVGDNIKVVVTTPGKENEHATLIFEKLFLTKATIGGKTETFNFALEEQKVTVVQDPTFRQQQIHSFQHQSGFHGQAQLNQAQMTAYIQRQYMAAQQDQKFYKNYKGYNGVNAVPPYGNRQGGQAHNGNQRPNNNSTNQGHLHQPASNNQVQNARNSFKAQQQMNKGKFNKNNTKTSNGGGRQQRAFNATETDFPSLN